MISIKLWKEYTIKRRYKRIIIKKQEIDITLINILIYRLLLIIILTARYD